MSWADLPVILFGSFLAPCNGALECGGLPPLWSGRGEVSPAPPLAPQSGSELPHSKGVLE